MSTAAIEDEGVVWSTFRALVQPKRLVPILVVSTPLIALQYRFTPTVDAVAIALLMCVAFMLIAPLSWRGLMPDGVSGFAAAARLAIYILNGLVVVGAIGWSLPHVLSMPFTILTVPSSLVVCVTLFLVGGWGLGRDIGLEARLLREQARTAELARAAETAQLLALRAHLDPHFLFNTLNAIAEWCREDGEVAERAVLQLSAILRAMLTGVRSPTWSLRTELDVVRDLFALHRLRDPSRFELRWSAPDEIPQVDVLPMILLPLAENAVKHGPAQGHRGVIELSVNIVGDRLILAVENPGKYAGPREGSDGLPIVERRLALAYDRALLRIIPRGDRTRMELDLPVSGPRRGVQA
jgi:signal transduction histidine kinase